MKPNYTLENWKELHADLMEANMLPVASVLREACAENERLRVALDIARTALLNIERRSEEVRAALSKIISEQSTTETTK